MLRLLLLHKLFELLSLQLDLCFLEFYLRIFEGGLQLVPVPVELCLKQ